MILSSVICNGGEGMKNYYKEKDRKMMYKLQNKVNYKCSFKLNKINYEDQVATKNYSNLNKNLNIFFTNKMNEINRKTIFEKFLKRKFYSCVFYVFVLFTIKAFFYSGCHDKDIKVNNANYFVSLTNFVVAVPNLFDDDKSRENVQNLKIEIEDDGEKKTRNKKSIIDNKFNHNNDLLMHDMKTNDAKVINQNEKKNATGEYVETPRKRKEDFDIEIYEYEDVIEKETDKKNDADKIKKITGNRIIEKNEVGTNEETERDTFNKNPHSYNFVEIPKKNSEEMDLLVQVDRKEKRRDIYNDSNDDDPKYLLRQIDESLSGLSSYSQDFSPYKKSLYSIFNSNTYNNQESINSDNFFSSIPVESDVKEGFLSYLLSKFPPNFWSFATNSDSDEFSSLLKKEGNFRGSSLFNRDFLNNLRTDNINAMRNNVEYYDYIVVGAGAVGCPLARTLAEANFSVLLIERGMNRTKHGTPLAMDIHGGGLVVNDETISQLIVTQDGIRTHVGNIMGGGTSINVGIIIEEQPSFFENLKKKFPAANFDEKIVEHAYDWVADRTANPMPAGNPYGMAWRDGLELVGFSPLAMKDRRKTIYDAVKDNKPYNMYNHSEITERDISEYSLRLQSGHRWRSYSLFNQSKNFYRHAADSLLGSTDSSINGWDKRPQMLRIKTGHTVQKVHFDTSSPTPKATCVSYRATMEPDFASVFSNRKSILGFPLPTSNDMLISLFNPLRSIQKLLNLYRSTIIGDTEYYACIRKGGKIILSAGAILSPSILFKSGVGPREQLNEIGVKTVKEIKDLGQHFSDRVLIPVGVFLDYLPSNKLYPSRICQFVGAKTLGPECETYKIGDETLKCTLATAEELSGGRLAEGLIYSTRYIFPPELRHHPVMEYIFMVLKDCSDNKMPFNNISLTPLCVLAQPIISCFRRVAASFYFTAEPKSRGEVKMNKDGSLIVTANYLKDEQDFFDSIRGLSSIIKIVNSDVYKGIIQPISSTSCPIAILNGVLDMILQVGTYFRPYVYGETENFQKVVKHMEDLIPHEFKRSRRLMVENKLVNVNKENAESLGLHRRLQEIFSIIPNEKLSNANINNERYRYFANHTYSNTVEKEDILHSNTYNKFNDIKYEEKANIETSSNICDRTDVYNFVYGCDSHKKNEENEILLDGQLDHKDTQDLLNGEAFRKYAQRSFAIQPSKKQWAATYPPVLPDPNNPLEVAKYALEYMTSIWHHTGTAQFGKVVDENFDVLGVGNLAIADASVLNLVTRMNPTATLMMMGRYAGLIMLRNRKIPIDSLLQ